MIHSKLQEPTFKDISDSVELHSSSTIAEFANSVDLDEVAQLR